MKRQPLSFVINEKKIVTKIPTGIDQFKNVTMLARIRSNWHSQVQIVGVYIDRMSIEAFIVAY